MEQSQSALRLTKITTISVFMIGLAAFVLSFFASGINGDYMLNIGLGTMVGAGFLFGSGMVLALLVQRPSERASES